MSDLTQQKMWSIGKHDWYNITYICCKPFSMNEYSTINRFVFGIFSSCIICKICVCIQSEIWIEFEGSKNWNAFGWKKVVVTGYDKPILQ